MSAILIPRDPCHTSLDGAKSSWVEQRFRVLSDVVASL